MQGYNFYSTRGDESNVYDSKRLWTVHTVFDFKGIAFHILAQGDPPPGVGAALQGVHGVVDQVAQHAAHFPSVSEMVYAAIDDYSYKDVFNGIGGNGWSSDATVDDKILCIIGELGGLREFDYNC